MAEEEKKEKKESKEKQAKPEKTKKEKKPVAYKKKRSCPKCGPGVSLADHGNRSSCGKCGYSEMKIAKKE